MYCLALGRITEDERQRILDILQPCCPGLFAASAWANRPQPALQTLDDEPRLAEVSATGPER